MSFSYLYSVKLWKTRQICNTGANFNEWPR